MSTIVHLERVVFKESIDVPGETSKPGDAPQYPGKEKILGNYDTPKGLMAKQRYNLWFDPSLGVVVVENPRSKEQEEVPFANVAQWRRKREAKEGKKP